MLKSRERDEAIQELVRALGQEVPGLRQDEVLQTIAARERDITTRIAPEIAIPHARIPGLGRFIVAAGFSRDGIAWGLPEGQPVRLVVLVVGDADEPREHLRVLSQLASVLRTDGVLARLAKASGSPEELYHTLVRLHEDARIPVQAGEAVLNQVLYEHACRICNEIEAAAVLMLADDGTDLSFIRAKPEGSNTILAISSRDRHQHQAGYFDAVIEVPIAGLAALHRLDLAILSAVSEGLADKGHMLVCVYGGPSTGRHGGDGIPALH